MARQHGITADTYSNLIIDSGALYKNYGEAGELLIGATRGGNNFNFEQEIREMEVDGAHGPVVGSQRIIMVAPKITANIVEWSPAFIQMAIAGSTTADHPDTPTKTHDEITRALTIAVSDYFTNITIKGECTISSTNYVECGISNALSIENLEIAFADKEESVATVTFMGHFQPTDLESEPWFIRYPIA